MIYFLAVLISVYLAAYCRQFRQFGWIISAMPLFLLSAFRYNVGTDYISYVNIFNNIDNHLGNIEPLWYILNVFLKYVTDDPIWIFVVSSAIFVFVVYKVIFENSSNVALSILLFIGSRAYFQSMNGIRQMLAAAVLFYGLQFIEKCSLWKFLLCVLIAYCFHYSAILFLPMYWIAKLRVNRWLVLGVLVVVFINRWNLDYGIRELISLTRYGNYLTGYYDDILKEGKFIDLIAQSTVFLLATFCYRDNFKYRVCYYCQVIMVVLSIFMGVIPLAWRVVYYFELPALLLIPMALERIRMSEIKVVFVASIIVCFSAYAYIPAAIISHRDDVIPYKSVFIEK